MRELTQLYPDAGAFQNKKVPSHQLNSLTTTVEFILSSVFTREGKMDQQHDELLEQASNSETVYEPRRNSNVKAAKVAGLTVLACLLLAGQAFTVYYVMAQKDHLRALETGQDSLKKELTLRRSVGGPKMVHTPMSKMPLLLNLDDSASPESKRPLTRLQPSFAREGSGLVDGSMARMAMPMASVPLLSKLEDENKVEAPAPVLETKCRMQAGKVMPGFFKPECDEQGNYLPKQCWHSTGFCWCVDKNGKEIPDTLTRGPLDCKNPKVNVSPIASLPVLTSDIDA